MSPHNNKSETISDTARQATAVVGWCKFTVQRTHATHEHLDGLVEELRQEGVLPAADGLCPCCQHELTGDAVRERARADLLGLPANVYALLFGSTWLEEVEAVADMWQPLAEVGA